MRGRSVSESTHMRLVTWNCRVGKFREKAEHIAGLRPDVLTVQEVSQADHKALHFAGDCQPTFRSQLPGPGRHIGVFSYTGMELAAVDPDEPQELFRRFRAQHNGRPFQVVAVWTAPTRQSRKTWYRQVIDGVGEHAGWIKQVPTVIMGDFNDSARYETTNWPTLEALLQPLGLVSAYHAHTGETPGKETRHTYFNRGKIDASAAHLDYCLVPRDWVPKITAVTVGAHADWHNVSDHVPLIVDLDW